MKLHRYVDHQRLHIVTKDVISLSISVLLLFRHYISHKITFGAPSSGGVLRSACGAFISSGAGWFVSCHHIVQVFSDILVAFHYFDICHNRQSNLAIKNPEFSQPVVAGHFQRKIW